MLSSKNTFKLLLKNLSIISVYDPSYAKKKNSRKFLRFLYGWWDYQYFL